LLQLEQSILRTQQLLAQAQRIENIYDTPTGRARLIPLVARSGQ
jgi:hypothetical protein